MQWRQVNLASWKNHKSPFTFSGGPAIADGKLIGVANFVVGGCGSSFPDGYAKVSFFKSWITEKIAKYEEKRPQVVFL